NGLAKLTGAPSTAIRTATSDTAGVVGIVTAGAGTSSTATIQIAGIVSCAFSGATTAGNYVGISDAIAGNCKDVGSSYPSAGQVIGRVLGTNASLDSHSKNGLNDFNQKTAKMPSNRREAVNRKCIE